MHHFTESRYLFLKQMELTDSEESQDMPRQRLKILEAVDAISEDLNVEVPAFSLVKSDSKRCSNSAKTSDKVRALPTVILIISN